MPDWDFEGACVMDLGGTHSWTFGGIVRSFVDLVFAYFLLCGSALAFFGSKACNFFGLYMPCPCSGIFGYQNGDLCLHKLLVECPSRIIGYVQMLAKSRFPFDSVLSMDQASNLNVNLNKDGKRGKGVPEVEGDGEALFSGMDTKGKRSVNQKQRSGFRRRRRVSLEYGKSSSVVGIGDGVPIFPYNGNDMKNEINQSLGHVDGGDDNLQGYGVSPTSIDMSERSWYSFQRSLSFEESKDGDTSSSVGKSEDKPEIFANEAKSTATLEQELEEERAASAALQVELEKERAAAASATDEAMAMILRLQKEKAALEMEAMQYQRLIEEKFAHDEDEMNILKEILVRREKENHFLEMELEAYKEMSSSQVEQFEDGLKNGSMIVAEPTVHDVHVVDDKMELHEGKNENRYKPVKESARLELLEEMLNRLQEVRLLQKPLRQASLPPPSPKVRMKRRRRCRSSVPWEARESE